DPEGRPGRASSPHGRSNGCRSPRGRRAAGDQARGGGALGRRLEGLTLGRVLVGSSCNIAIPFSILRQSNPAVADKWLPRPDPLPWLVTAGGGLAWMPGQAGFLSCNECT